MNINLIAQLLGFAASIFTAVKTNSTTLPPLLDVGQEEREYVANFYIDHPEATPEQGHYAWVSFKEAQGWTRGDVYDAANKKHPSLVVWEELNDSLKLKNSVTRQTVAQLVNLLPVSDEIKTGVNVVAGTAEEIYRNHQSGGADS